MSFLHRFEGNIARTCKLAPPTGRRCMWIVMMAAAQVGLYEAGGLAVAAPKADNSSQGKPAVLEVGDPAPEFRAKTDNFRRLFSEDLIGHRIMVVYFYPADMTPGCTKQACSYRDVLQKDRLEGVEVLGVSGDTEENHRHF